MESCENSVGKRCYTVKELQDILGISRPTAYELLKKNFVGLKLEQNIVSPSRVLMNGWIRIGMYRRFTR